MTYAIQAAIGLAVAAGTLCLIADCNQAGVLLISVAALVAVGRLIRS
jgi:hypothetical protein